MSVVPGRYQVDRGGTDDDQLFISRVTSGGYVSGTVAAAGADGRAGASNRCSECSDKRRRHVDAATETDTVCGAELAPLPFCYGSLRMRELLKAQVGDLPRCDLT